MSTPQSDPGKLYMSTREFVALIKERHLSTFTLGRFQRDRMDGVAPEPAATMGQRHLWLESQAPGYVAKLLNSAPLKRHVAKGARPAGQASSQAPSAA